MKVIKRFFSSSIYIPANELCEQYLATVKLNTPQVLPDQYQSLLTLALSKCQKPHEFLAELLKAYKELNDHTSVLKMLTLIHNFVIEREYFREDIQDLEDFDIHILCGKDQKQVWFVDFCRSYITYLMKLPALADVYSEIGKKQYGTPPAQHLTHIFRITNTARVLFPSVTNAINVIGRYQAGKHAAIKELYMLLSAQLVKLYSYIKFLCDQILRQYRVYNPKDLRCFIQTLPEMELLCDKIEDLLVNKYLKGKKITSKIQFKEERVAEVLYYLDYEYPAKNQPTKTSEGKNSNRTCS